MTENSQSSDAVSNDGDTAQKREEEILEQQIVQGTVALHRSRWGLFLSALSAGLDIGFTLLTVSVFVTIVGGMPEDIAGRLIMGALYPAGYIFVILGRSELFTEHTTLAVVPVLDGEISVGRLGRLWAIVYAGNIVGTALFALLYCFFAPRMGVASVESFVTIALSLVEHDVWSIALSGVLAGWLMGLLSWLVTASRDTISQVVIICLVTGVIGFGELHHCIAGSAEMLAAVFSSDQVGWFHYGKFLLFASVGNALGGVVFVALLKYSHVIQSD